MLNTIQLGKLYVARDGMLVVPTRFETQRRNKEENDTVYYYELKDPEQEWAFFLDIAVKYWKEA